MVNDIAAIARQRAKAAVGRVARPAAFGIVAGVFFLFAVAALFYALFFWLEPLYGPPVAALIVAAVALVLGLLATAPLIVGRRPEPAAPPASGATLPQVVSLLAQSASSLGPKQSAMTAVVLAVALGFMERGSARRKT
jgi:hypothetical protein